MSLVRNIVDGLMNVVSGLGTERDKAAYSVYAAPVWQPLDLINAYRGAWLPKKIVDVPALDSCRKWRDWQAENEQIEKIEAEEKRLNVLGKVLDARIKARLHGGAAIFIGDGSANPAEEFDPERVGKGGVKYLTVLTRYQLTAGEIERDPMSEWYGRPKMFSLAAENGAQVDIHPSRLVLFVGEAIPDFDVGMSQQGWGDSVLVSTLDAIRRADETAANIASLVFEAKIDVINVPNLMQSLSDPAYEQRMSTRFTAAALGKGNLRTLLLDGEEEYHQKTMTFATLPDILDRFLQIVSGAADIPATRLLGQSPAGLNSTGESDLRNYYDRIAAAQQIEMTPAMARMDEAIIRSALGNRPPEVHYIWSSLWQISDKERAEIGEKIANTANTLSTAALYPPEALAQAVANTLVEHSILPGLEAALEEFGTEVPKVDLGQPDNDNDEDEGDDRRVAANDAAPRTLYVRRDVINKADIVKWAEAQGFTDIVPELHVTIAYSTTPVDWFAVGTSWSEKLDIAAGGPRQMDRLGDDGQYIVLLITASELVWRHKEIIEAGASWSWPDYQPHISIQIGGDVDLNTVEPYQGKIVLGPEIFEEVKT